MRPDTKIKVSKRKYALDLLRWLYTRRDPTLCGSRLSLEHRRAQAMDTRALTYGEVDISDFLSILDIVKPRDGEVFVDLGSGTGKAVFTAACGFSEFSECRGIELVRGLSDAATHHLGTLTALSTRATGSKEVIAEREDIDCRASHAGIKVGSRCLQNAKQEKPRARGMVPASIRGPKSKKMVNQGLSATDLNGLIADLLTKKASSQDQNEINHVDASPRAYSVEDIAVELVKILGHRRYKASLRGHGGLQRFLTRGDGATLQRLIFAQDSGTVALKSAQEPSGNSDVKTSEMQQEFHRSYSGELLSDVGETACAAPQHVAGTTVVNSSRRQRGGDGVVVVDDSEYKAADGLAKGCDLGGGESIDSDGKTRGCGETARVSPETCIEPNRTECFGDRAPKSCLAANGVARSSDVGPLHDKYSTVSMSKEASEASPLDCSRIENATSSGSNNGVRNGQVEADGFARRPPPAGALPTPESLERIKFVCGDFFEETWDDADVIYMASLLFSDEMMLRLGRKISKLKKGARIISLKPIPLFPREHPAGVQSVPAMVVCQNKYGASVKHSSPTSSPSMLCLVYEGVFKMSWQMARVFIYLVHLG